MDKKTRIQLIAALLILIAIPLVLLIVALITKDWTAFYVSLYPCGLIGGLMLGTIFTKQGAVSKKADSKYSSPKQKY